jgi:hypothetical protein
MPGTELCRRNEAAPSSRGGDLEIELRMPDRRTEVWGANVYRIFHCTALDRSIRSVPHGGWSVELGVSFLVCTKSDTPDTLSISGVFSVA